jgi:hypothetical protein
MPITSPDIHPSVDHPPPTSTAAPNPGRSYSPQSSVRRASNVFADNNLVTPDHDHLELIAHFAVQAQLFILTAAMYDPDEYQLNHVFNQFVLACALPAQGS